MLKQKSAAVSAALIKRVKRLKEQHPKRLFLACLVTALLILTSTLAWFSAADSKENNFKSAHYEFQVNVVDHFLPPLEIEPDKEITKIVSATNTGTVDAFVRVMVFPVALKDGIPMEVNLNDRVQLSSPNITHWRFGNDGYYYYLGKLSPGETAPTLFESVTLTIPAGASEYADAEFDIIVKTEAVDTVKWNYRSSWWGTQEEQDASDTAYKAIDDILSSLTK
ncbi:SipW-dependent-type signal peptide-containing protein [Vagococcus acidifermentans]|uniref:Uncharacterized protein n=1 Tax=Vagococcus acidifermentans TaxID=564710 RepID=A0A430AVL6_9ENTE|nr:SipW-dependent-type signal peptide-containing protein [Vagococcus acidifermentans]RSU12091.1 hypothetical protein CBF27_06605 [Vagococcus acidifermentans]